MAGLLLAGCLGLAGCGGGASPSSTATAGASVPSQATPTPAPTGATTAPASPTTPAASASPGATPTVTSVPGVEGLPMDIRVRIVSDASDRTGAPPGSYVFAEVTPVTWPDGSLGCPQPGHSYTQALIPGWQVILVVSGTTRLDYRVTVAGVVSLCEHPIPLVSPSG